MAKRTGLKEGDLIAFGHTHKSWTRKVEGIHFVNTGSVGKPKDGDWRAGYALVETSEEIGAVEFVRVEYDLERAMEGIRKSQLPDEFADQLRAGGRRDRSSSRRGRKETVGEGEEEGREKKARNALFAPRTRQEVRWPRAF